MNLGWKPKTSETRTPRDNFAVCRSMLYVAIFNRYEKTNERFQKLKTESDVNAMKIQDEIYKSLMESDRNDRMQSLENKLDEKEEEMAKL